MNKYDTAIVRLAEAHLISTKTLDQTLLEVWGNEYDAKMCCNSLMRNGLIDYCGDGEWEITIPDSLVDDIKNEAPDGWSE